MRLLSKTSLLIITVSIFIFLVGNIVFFHITKGMIIKHVDKELVNQMHTVIKNLKKHQGQTYFFTDEISIDTVAQINKAYPVFSDTVLYNQIQNKYIPHRILKFNWSYKQEILELSISKSLLSSDNLIEKITLASIIMVVTFIVMIFALNQFVFEKVWSNFFKNIKKVASYNINGSSELILEESEIDEFNALNKVHKKMVERIQNDFTSLKELTANTSHEIQTPLAIMRGKAELLLQSEKLGEDEMNTVNSILLSIDRLSKLNKSLLLITKIENNQFSETTQVNLQEVLERHLQGFQMFFDAENFTIEVDLQTVFVEINVVLLDVLIQNLLKNALTHGKNEKNIKILLKDSKLQILNSGDNLPFPPDEIFNRFVKNANVKGNSGLGLEIVSKICKCFGLSIAYSFENSMHSFIVDFKEVEKKTA